MTPEELARCLHPGSALSLMLLLPGADRAKVDLRRLFNESRTVRITPRVGPVGVAYRFVPIPAEDW